MSASQSQALLGKVHVFEHEAYRVMVQYRSQSVDQHVDAVCLLAVLDMAATQVKQFLHNLLCNLERRFLPVLQSSAAS